MPISVEDAMMRDAVARLEQATYSRRPVWQWDPDKLRAYIRPSEGLVVAGFKRHVCAHWDESGDVGFVVGTDPLVMYRTPHGAMDAAMAAAEATINGHAKKKP